MSALSKIDGGPLVDKPTIWQAFMNNVNKSPEALGLVCTHQPCGLFGYPNMDLDHEAYREQPYLRWSYQSVYDAIVRLATAWHTQGIQEGSILMTFVQNSAEYVLAAYAAVSMGCKLMPINPRNLINREEVAHMIKTGLSISTGQKLVVLAGNEQLAKTIDELGILPAGALKISLTEQRPDSTWVAFQNLMNPETITNGNGQTKDLGNESFVDKSTSSKAGTILFTSGTTSTPKGVFHPYQRDLASIMPYQKEAAGQRQVRRGSRFCCFAPNNHAMGWIGLTWPFTVGAALILPGPVFDPFQVIRALRMEKATHMVMVPTMVHALVAAKAESPEHAAYPLSDLENVFMGGSSVAPETMRLVTQDLGAQGSANIWGCTEGLLSRSSWVSDPAELQDKQELSVGWPLPGNTFKVVDPETNQIVPRGVLGEVEGSGNGIFEPYIGGTGQDVWYRDEAGVLWHKTGDQGRMDDKGRLFISGRYKDMIIRGGENISPSAIEAVLIKNPLISSMVPQVVGAKDPIAGEVPVAIVRSKVTSEVRDAIQNEIVQSMGPLYVPEDVLSTEDLGLADYPRTTLGKIQKTKLAALVNEYLSSSVKSDASTLSSEHLTEEIRAIWAKAVGLDPSHIRLDAPITEFADSITVMRVRERIKRQTGKTLTLAEMTATETIQKQIELLRNMSAGSTGKQKAWLRRPVRIAPLTAEDMAHLTEDPDLFEPTREVVLQSISQFGLDWNDIEDIVPAYDFNALMSQTGLYDSWRVNFAVQPRNRLDKAQLRTAFEAVVCNHRILASVLVWNSDMLDSKEALHVIMKQAPAIFNLMFEDGGELETLEELESAAKKPTSPELVDYPGPLCRITLFHVHEIEGAAMVVSLNHAVVDASHAQRILEDLDRTLAVAGARSGVSATELLSGLEPHVDYKIWADSYYNLKTSIEARVATKWHVKRLKSLPEHVKAGALFPSAVRSGEAVRIRRGAEPVAAMVDVPEFHTLRKEHPEITAPVVVKAAIALANVHRTGHSHAVFGSLEAARTYFPFVPKAIVEHATGGHQLEATDVNGPTYQMAFNLVEVKKGGQESAMQFLRRMQVDQTALSKYASAPLREIMRGLDEVSPGSGDLIPRIIDAQHLNWRPGLATSGPDEFQNLKTLDVGVSPTTGLVFHAGLGGSQGQTLFLYAYADGLRVMRDEAASMGETVVAITKWLTTKDNWNLPVGGLLQTLGD